MTFALALQAGGSPTFTLTEDFALGMEMKKLHWHCRYVQAYLALGEAPEQIRNCFQQRSRWCKVQPHSPPHLLLCGAWPAIGSWHESAFLQAGAVVPHLPLHGHLS